MQRHLENTQKTKGLIKKWNQYHTLNKNLCSNVICVLPCVWEGPSICWGADRKWEMLYWISKVIVRSEKIFSVYCDTVAGWWQIYDQEYMNHMIFFGSSWFLFLSVLVHIFHKSQEKSWSCAYWCPGQLMLELWLFLSHAEMSWNMKKFKEINVTFTKKSTERENISWLLQDKELTDITFMTILKLSRPITPWNVMGVNTYYMS